IDYLKYEEDAKWDGLKGYLTNSRLTTKKIIENYNQLWQIEKAFRVAKTDLKVRPIYHRLQKRIEAHICLNFVAYKVYKELERWQTEK
ncbi:transposase, partial [Streptomyces sp. UMAF16]|nr:transposase [Streptomyces sp. UMAF16]